MTPEIQEQQHKLETLTSRQTRYKAINVAYRNWKKNPATLVKSGLSDEDMRVVQEWTPRYSYEKAPIQAYELTNLNATIKNTMKRIEELTSRHAEAEAATENVEIAFSYEGDTGNIIYNYTDDRVQLDFDGKPSPGMIERLKRHGFRWAPSVSVWQRQLTDNAKRDAAYITRTGQWALPATAQPEPLDA